MIRVLIVEPAGNLWGSERVLLDFLQHIDYSANHILVCCPPNSPIVKALRKYPVKVSTTFEANLHQRGRVARLINAARLLFVAFQYHPHVIYVNQAGATRISLFVGRMLHVPVVTHVRIVEDVNYIISLQSKENELPKIICISNYIYSLFAHQSILNSRLTTLYDSYTPQKFSDVVPVNATDSAELSLISVGRVIHAKGQDVLIKAAACLYQQGVNVKIYFVGNIDENNEFEAYLRKLAIDLDIATQVEWLGFQDEVLNYISHKKALVVTSYCEPLGRVIFEAWDAGTIPVAWAGSGGAAEILKASGGGLLYEEQTGESLAITLKHLFSLDLVDREALVSRGRKWLLENCDPETYSLHMQAIWHTVVVQS